MKGFLVPILILALAFTLAPLAFAQDANTAIDDADQMLWSRNPSDGVGQIDASYPVDAAGPGVRWQVNSGTASSGWWAIQIGDNYPVGTQDDSPNAAISYGFPVTSGYADLSGYDEYKLAFTNNSATDWVEVKVTANGGPPGWAYAESPGQWVPPGETRVEVLDLTTVPLRNQATNISFKLGSNYGSTNSYDATHFDVTVASFPIDVHVDDDWTSQLDVDAYDSSLTWGADAFATVAGGVGVVAAGGTVHVHDGTYAEALQIATPWIGVVGTGSGLVTIDPTGSAYNNAGIHVTADHVTLQGLALASTITSSLPRYGIKLNQVEGATLDDVEIRDVYRTGLDMLGGGGHTINDVYVHDNGGNGMQSVDVNGIAYSNITTSNNSWGGVGVFTYGQYSPIGTSDIVFTGTNSFGETVSDVGGLYLEEGNDAVPASPYPITWSTNPLDGADVTIQIADFTHFMRGDSDNDNEYTRFYATLADAQSAAAGAVSHILTNRYIGEIDGTNWYVPANLGGIQAAVDAASPDDVVHVDAATFTEQVDIGKNLTLSGAGTSTVIESPASLAVSFTTSSAKKAVVCAHDAPDVTVQNLTVDGLGLGNANVQFIGVAYRNAGGTVSGCDILNIEDTPFSGAQHGVALYAYNDDLVARNLDVLGCYFEGFQKNAMALNAGATTPLTVNVSGNTVVGAGATTVTAQNGIQVYGDLITGTIDGNTVDGIAYDNTSNPTKWVATSILDFYTAVDITNNTTTNGHVGVYKIDGQGTIGSNDLTIVKVGVRAWGIIATDPPAAVPTPFDAPVSAGKTGVMGAAAASASLLTVDITGNTVVFSGGDNTDTFGLEADAGYGPNDLAVTATGNSVSGFDVGFDVWQCQSGCDTGVFTSVDINNNEFLNNTTAGLRSNVGYLTVDGTCNWWGSLAGPNDPPGNPSAGDDVVGSVTYAPWLDGSIAGSPSCNQYGDYVAADPTGLCISGPTPCVTSAVEFVRNDTTPARGVTVTVELSSELELCGAGIVQGDWLDGYGLGSNFQVTDLGGGVYVVDQAVLGGTASCGPTTGGTLFTLDVTNTGADGTGTITVTAVDARDCGNPFAYLPGIPGPPADVQIDYTAPAAVADLAASQVKSGNDNDGTTKIDLSWTAPPEPDVTSVEIYAKGFGFYPEYDDNGGSVPATPADPATAVGAGWTHVVSLAGAASAYTDEPATRDYWYYVAYVIDDCGNISAVSNETDGTLNYHLGDVAVSPGDNLVAGVDISALGAAYGTVDGNALYDNELDVGPTDDNSTDGLPTTDNAIQFEDLILCAINYGTVSKPGIKPVAADRNAVSVEGPEAVTAGSIIEVPVMLSSDGAIQGVSVPLTWNASVVEPVEMIPGDFLDRQPAQAMAFSPGAGTVDAAVFGATFAGEGELARIVFRVVADGNPGIALGEVAARDAENRKVDLELTTGVGDGRTLPTLTRLMPNAPNPFRSATAIRFALAEDGPVTLRVYSVDGRLVRTLVQSVLPAGERSVQWDGRDDGGRAVAAGTYLLKLQAAKTSQSQRIVRLR